MKKNVMMVLTGMIGLMLIVGCTSTVEDTVESEIVESETVESEAGVSDTLVSETVEPMEPQSSMLPQFVIYKGESYVRTNQNGVSITEDLVGDKIGETTAFIDFTSGEVDESLFQQELANSISESAVLYKMNGYLDDFRILLNDNGTYYICETVAMNPQNLLEYTQHAISGSVTGLYGTTVYQNIPQEELMQLMEFFAHTEEASLTDADYEAIGKAQSEGKAYQFHIIYEDETKTELLIMPELNLVSIGQTYYTSDSLQSDVAFVFEGLPQEGLPQDMELISSLLQSGESRALQDIEDGIFLLYEYEQLEDGTWTAGEYNYEYRLELTGRLQGAAQDSTYIVLSNTSDLTFEQAWKASGLSSNLADYFKPEDAIIVELRMESGY